MQDLYDKLGVKEGISDADLKSAYKKLATKYHPDKTGGNEEKFKEINAAYDILKDPNKRAEHQAKQDFRSYQSRGQGPGFGPGNIPPDIEIIIKEMMGNRGPFRNPDFGTPHFSQGFEGASNRQYRNTPQNRDIKITLELTLEEAYISHKKTLIINLSNNNKETISIDIPGGVKDNTFVKYPGLGDNAIETERRGDLYVNIKVKPDPNFERVNNHLIVHKTIDCIDAILGTKIEVKTLDNRSLSVTINKGTQNGTVLKLKGEGMPIPDKHSDAGRRPALKGDMQVIIHTNIPSTLTNEQYELLKQVKDKQ